MQKKEKKELRAYQKQAVEDFISAIKEDYKKRYIIVIPTGGGKSLIQSEILIWLTNHPGTRCLCLTHDKRVIKQNYNEFIENTGFYDAGVYSAGLKSRDQFNRIIFAGIQSVYKKAINLGAFDLIIIDECHRIPHKQNGMYWQFIKDTLEINPKTIIAGMTATQYRMTTGLLTEGKDKLFDEVCHETTIKQLQDLGFLVPFKMPKKSMTAQVDVSSVKKTAGEYNQKELAAVYDIDPKVKAAVTEIINYCNEDNRKRVLIFCAGIEHSEHVSAEINSRGETCNFAHSKQTDSDIRIKEFAEGKYRFFCNKVMLTTGYNVPEIDCIVFLMSTLSPGLYVQIAGRGTRLAPWVNKKDCLILDFGNNIKTHGPIDEIEIVTKKDGKKELQKAPQKECPTCGSLLPLQARECLDCGYIYEFELKHDDKPDIHSNIISQYKIPEWADVKRIDIVKHPGKNGKPDSLRVDYCNDFIKIMSDYFCLDHGGFATRTAKNKLKTNFNLDFNSVDEALKNIDLFQKPDKIMIDNNEKYPKIIRYQFPEINEKIPF